MIYFDGGCRGNQNADNVGGWGVVLEYKGHKKELYGSEQRTTNNKMELTGAIRALQALKTTDIPVEIHGDSAYVINGMTKWVAGWKKKKWKKSDGKQVENLQLWKYLDELSSMQDNITWVKVKGHSDNEGNNRADELANIAMDEVSK